MSINAWTLNSLKSHLRTFVSLVLNSRQARRANGHYPFLVIVVPVVIFRLFESVVKYFDAFLNLIPLSFVLGFYVSYVASRWWQQFLAIPWPDKSFHTIALYIPGWDEDSRMLRRSLLRWMNLALILVLRSISSAVKQRFPTVDHVVEAGELELR